MRALATRALRVAIMAAGLEKDTDGLGAVGGYRELNQYTELGGSLTIFTLPN